MKKVLILAGLILSMFLVTSCGTVEEVYEDTPTYTIIIREGTPYYYYYGHYYTYPPVRYHYYYHRERPHRPRPNCSGVPAPKPPKNRDFSRPSRPSNNGGGRPHTGGNRNGNGRTRR